MGLLDDIFSSGISGVSGVTTQIVSTHSQKNEKNENEYGLSGNTRHSRPKRHSPPQEKIPPAPKFSVEDRVRFLGKTSRDLLEGVIIEAKWHGSAIGLWYRINVDGQKVWSSESHITGRKS